MSNRPRRRSTLRAPLLFLVTLAVAACQQPVDVSWHTEAGYRWRALRLGTRGKPHFEALSSKRTGLTHRNDVSDQHALANRNLLIGGGVAVGDIDNDGLPDVFLCSVERPAVLYHNDGDFHFTDVTAKSGLRLDGLATLSAAFADVNGDGALDLIVGTLGGPLKLWLGDGHGHFTDATDGSGLVGGYAVTALTFADVDGDGDLDLYAATYKTRNALDAYPPQARTFEQVVHKVGNRYSIDPKWAPEFRIEDRPELGGVMRSQRAEPDLFFLNDGRGFRHKPDGFRFASPPQGTFTGMAAADYDRDGSVDLYLCTYIYFQSEDGVTTVVRAAQKFERLATNTMGERTFASFAVADGAIYLRTETQLYRIQAK